MPAMTSALSAICGTHFGLTKLVTSISLQPAACSRCTSSIFTAAGTGCASFCSPSRGPTSTRVTWVGFIVHSTISTRIHPSWREPQELAALGDLVAHGVEQFLDDTVARRRHRVLHLHRLHDRHRLAALDGLAL